MSAPQRPDYVARVATVPFHLGRPEDLLARPDAPRAGDTVRKLLCRLTQPTHRASMAGLLAAVTQVRGQLGAPAARPVADDPQESEANRDNDLAFGIVRVHGPAVPLLVDAALAAWAGLLELAVRQGSGLDPGSWRRLIGGFDALLGLLTGQPAAPDVPPAAPPGHAEPEDALRRWVRGHHVFMVFAQGCALAVTRLGQLAQRGDLPRAEAAAAAAIALMHGSEGALRYAADANSQQYLTEIRPTLTPPIAPPKMSGLHWRDHEALVGALSTGKDAWRWLGRRRPELLHEFRTALDEAYTAHQGVCQHFVGTESPSLLAAKGSSRSAVGVLAQFRRIRLDALPSPEPSRERQPAPRTTTLEEAHSHAFDV